MKNLYNNRNLVKEIKNKKRWHILLPLSIITAFLAQLILFFINICSDFDIGYIVCMLCPFITFGCAKNDANLEKNIKFVNNLVRDINGKNAYQNNLYLSRLNDIEIIPKNIQVGEDLSAKNIVPIFKEGHYILMGSLPNLCLMRQVKQDDKMTVDIYEEEEMEDILTQLKEEYPKLEKRLKNDKFER